MDAHAHGSRVRRQSAWYSAEAVVHFKKNSKHKHTFTAGPDQTGLGSLQGLLTKQAQNLGKAQERWCVLSNEFLIYYENEATCLNPKSLPKGLLNLRRVESVDLNGSNFTLSFDKASGVAPRVFTAASEKDAARWTKNITRRLEWLSQGKGPSALSNSSGASGPVLAAGIAGIGSVTKQAKARDKLTFRCFEIQRTGKREKLIMRELVIDNFGASPKLTMRATATDSRVESRTGIAPSAHAGANGTPTVIAADSRGRRVTQTCLQSLDLVTHLIRCNVSTDAKMFYCMDEGYLTPTSVEYRFPDSATRDNFCYSLHLLHHKIRVLEEGEVAAGKHILNFQVKYIFRNLLSRTGTATLDLRVQIMTLSGYHFLKTKDVRIHVTPKVQILAHPTKPLHLLIGCEGGFNVTIFDTESKRIEKSTEANLSELDIKFPSVVLRERFAGRLRAMVFGLIPPYSRASSRQRISTLRNFRGRMAVWTTTFNAANKTFSAFKDLNRWLPTPEQMRRNQYDIFCFGLQESRQFPKWAVGLLNHINRAGSVDVEAENDEMMVKKGESTLTYQLLCSHSIGAIHLLVFVRKALASDVSQVIMSKIPTGANVLGVAQGNKGAVGCTFLLGGCERVCFIACHLNARAEKVQRRGEDFANIYRGISMDQQENCYVQMVDNIDHIFWIGDLNYRTEMRDQETNKSLMNTRREYEAACKLAASKQWDELVAWDQLHRETASGAIFAGFDEHPIHFAPTYRMVKDKAFAYGLKTPTRFQAPSYCDRILWHHNKTSIEVEGGKDNAGDAGESSDASLVPSFACTSYTASHEFLGSDHRAVVATFQLNLRMPYINLDPVEELGSVNFSSIVPLGLELRLTPQLSKLLGTSKAGMQVEFFAPLVLAAPFCSHSNGVWDADRSAWVWAADQLPTLVPFVPDRDFLRGRQVTVVFRSRFGTPNEIGNVPARSPRRGAGGGKFEKTMDGEYDGEPGSDGDTFDEDGFAEARGVCASGGEPGRRPGSSSSEYARDSPLVPLGVRASLTHKDSNTSLGFAGDDDDEDEDENDDDDDDVVDADAGDDDVTSEKKKKKAKKTKKRKSAKKTSLFTDGAIVAQAAFRLAGVDARENMHCQELHSIPVTRDGSHAGMLCGTFQIRNLCTSVSGHSPAGTYASVEELEEEVRHLSGAQMLDALGNWDDDDDEDDDVDSALNSAQAASDDEAFHDAVDGNDDGHLTPIDRNKGSLLRAGSRVGIRGVLSGVKPQRRHSALGSHTSGGGAANDADMGGTSSRDYSTFVSGSDDDSDGSVEIPSGAQTPTRQMSLESAASGYSSGAATKSKSRRRTSDTKRGGGRRGSMMLKPLTPDAPSRERLDSDRRGSVYDTFGFRAQARSVLQLMKLSSKAKATGAHVGTNGDGDDTDNTGKGSGHARNLKQAESSGLVVAAARTKQHRQQLQGKNRQNSSADFRVFNDALNASSSPNGGFVDAEFDLLGLVRSALNDEVLFICKQQAIPLEAITFLAMFFFCAKSEYAKRKKDTRAGRDKQEKGPNQASLSSQEWEELTSFNTVRQEELVNWLLEANNQFPVESRCATVEDSQVVIGLLVDSGCIGIGTTRSSVNHIKHSLSASSLSGVLTRQDTPCHKASDPDQVYCFTAWKSDYFEELTLARVQAAVQQGICDPSNFVVGSLAPPSFSASEGEDSDGGTDIASPFARPPPPPGHEFDVSMESLGPPSRSEDKTAPQKTQRDCRERPHQAKQPPPPRRRKPQLQKSGSNAAGPSKGSAVKQKTPSKREMFKSTSQREDDSTQGFLTGTTDVASAVRVLNDSTMNYSVTRKLSEAYVFSAVRNKIIVCTKDITGMWNVDKSVQPPGGTGMDNVQKVNVAGDGKLTWSDE